MSRRSVCGWLAAATVLATPVLVGAQPGGAPRLAFLSVASQSTMASRIDAFRQGLRELGYVEGQNLDVEYRWAEGKHERLAGLAAELLGPKPRMMLVHGTAAVLAARQASATVPIVCFACGDLVSTGLVASLARPGGNLTGLTFIHPEITAKRLELLKQIVPGLARVAVLPNPSNPVSGPELKETETGARALGLQLLPHAVKDPSGFAGAVAAMTRQRADAVIVLSDAMFYGQRQQIADLAVAARLPAISWTGEFASAGGLMTYGPDVHALARRAATYVDRLLKGARPADVPIEAPTKFELVVNLRTASTLGLTIPQALLLRADDIVQ